MHLANTGDLNDLMLIRLWKALLGTTLDIETEDSERGDLVVLVLERQDA
jgi:hypothetical protein